jgi:hypothetical protein
LSRPVTFARAAQVAEKRDPCNRAARVTSLISQSERLQHRNNNFLKEFYMMNNNDFFVDVIYAYTRKQAIADGELIDVSEVAREAGFRLDVAITSAVWSLYISWNGADTDKQCYQDESGRLWDAIWMLRMAINGCKDKSELQYRFYVIPRDGRSRRPRLITLKVLIHGGEPVITVMLPVED